MKRRVIVPKTEKNTCILTRKGKEWHCVAVWDAIMPDEMERIISTASFLTKTNLDWCYSNNRQYAVYYLSSTTAVEANSDEKQTEVMEMLQWLKPVHEKSREWAIAHNIEFTDTVNIKEALKNIV